MSKGTSALWLGFSFIPALGALRRVHNCSTWPDFTPSRSDSLRSSTWSRHRSCNSALPPGRLDRDRRGDLCVARSKKHHRTGLRLENSARRPTSTEERHQNTRVLAQIGLISAPIPFAMHVIGDAHLDHQQHESGLRLVAVRGSVDFVSSLSARRLRTGRRTV